MFLKLNGKNLNLFSFCLIIILYRKSTEKNKIMCLEYMFFCSWNPSLQGFIFQVRTSLVVFFFSSEHFWIYFVPTKTKNIFIKKKIKNEQTCKEEYLKTRTRFFRSVFCPFPFFFCERGWKFFFSVTRHCVSLFFHMFFSSLSLLVLSK